MRKTRFIIFAMLLALGCNSANAQMFNFADNNHHFTLGVQLGQAGVNTDYSGFGWGISTSLYGVYVDFLCAGPKHRNDYHVNSSRPSDHEAFAINVGYQIPVTSWLRIAPIIGYCQTNYGYTDMSTVRIHVSGRYRRGSIYHDYYPQERFHDFNYGAGLFIQPFKYFEIYGVYTSRAIYGGFALNLSAFAGDK